MASPGRSNKLHATPTGDGGRVAERRLVSIPEAREILGGIGHTTIYELIKNGHVVKVSIGRRSFITAESLGAYVDRITEAATA